MEIVAVDPRDQQWECGSPSYRVHFHEGTSSDEYEVRGAESVQVVIEWAEDDHAGRRTCSTPVSIETASGCCDSRGESRTRRRFRRPPSRRGGGVAYRIVKISPWKP